MKKNQVLLGVFCAILYFAWKLALYFTGNQHDILPRFPIAPLLGVLGLSIIFAVTKLSPVPFSMMDGFKAGARTGLVAALATMVFVFIYYSFIDPSYFAAQNAEVRAVLEAMPIEAERVEALKNFEENKKMFKPFNYSAVTLSGVSAFSMVFSLLVAGLYEMFRKFSTL